MSSYFRWGHSTLSFLTNQSRIQKRPFIRWLRRILKISKMITSSGMPSFPKMLQNCLRSFWKRNSIILWKIKESIRQPWVTVISSISKWYLQCKKQLQQSSSMKRSHLILTTFHIIAVVAMRNLMEKGMERIR